MPQPTEHKTVQSSILKYAQEIGWKYISRTEAEKRRVFNDESNDIHERCRTASLYFEDTLYSKIKEFFKEYKEMEMLYEIISPDAFLRPYIDGYASFSAMYAVVSKAYTKKVYVDRDFQRKTNELVKKQIDTQGITAVNEIIAIDEKTIDIIKKQQGNDNTKIINLIKSIEKTADDQSDDPYLIAMADRAKNIQDKFEERQTTTADALTQLLNEIRLNEERKRQQESLKLDNLTFFIFKQLELSGLADPASAGKDLKKILTDYPDWLSSEKSMREARQKMTFRILRSVEDLDKVSAIVNDLLYVLSIEKRKT